MKTIAQTKLVWFNESANSPDLQEESFAGTLKEALAAMESRSTEDGFILGQVLELDGKVLATVAAGGAMRFSGPEAQALAA